ncbi:hypothetical protein J6590_105648 [Homalodisca vitripennis]|nr:hypothetical protein J6590_105648 [Homalodisca vitripennis]
MPHHVHVTAFHEEYTTPRVRYSLPRGVCHTTCTLQPSTRSMPHDVYVTAFHEEYATPRVRYSLPRGVCHTTCTLQSSTMSMPHHVYVTAFHEEYATPRVRYSLPRGVCHTTCTLQPSTRSMPHHVYVTAFHEEYATPRVRYSLPREYAHHVYVTAFHEEYATPRVRYGLPRGVCHTTCTLQPSTRIMPHHVYVTAFHEEYATPRVRFSLPRDRQTDIHAEKTFLHRTAGKREFVSADSGNYSAKFHGWAGGIGEIILVNIAEISRSLEASETLELKKFPRRNFLDEMNVIRATLHAGTQAGVAAVTARVRALDSRTWTHLLLVDAHPVAHARAPSAQFSCGALGRGVEV